MKQLIMRLFGRGDVTCAEVAEVMQSYLDGEVGVSEARRVSDHIDRCANCGPEFAVYQRIKTSLHAGHGGPVDQDALGRLRDFADQVARGDVPQLDFE